MQRIVLLRRDGVEEIRLIKKNENDPLALTLVWPNDGLTAEFYKVSKHGYLYYKEI